MGLIDLVQELESPDAPTRFKAATAIYRMGPQAVPAIPKLVGLLRDFDGVNVPDSEGGERLVTIAERCALALAAIGEPAAAAVIEELKRDNPVSAIHCVRALASPALAKRVPIAVVNERLLRPKVSPAMAAALCEVLYAACQAPDETQRNAAKSAFKAAYAAGRVTQKFHKLFTPAGTTPTPAAPGTRVGTSATPTPLPTPAPVAPPPPPPPAPAPPPPAPVPAAAPAAEHKSDVPGLRPGSQFRTGRGDRPTAFGFEAVSEEAEETPAPEAPPRVLVRPDPPPADPLPRVISQTTATFDPEVLFPGTPIEAPGHEPQRVGSPTATFEHEKTLEPGSRAVAAAVTGPIAYEAGERFSYRQQIDELLKKGAKLQAVNLLRQKTGASLVEALRQIETWS